RPSDRIPRAHSQLGKSALKSLTAPNNRRAQNGPNAGFGARRPKTVGSPFHVKRIGEIHYRPPAARHSGHHPTHEWSVSPPDQLSILASTPLHFDRRESTGAITAIRIVRGSPVPRETA